MKLAIGLLLLASAAPAPEIRYFHYQRLVDPATQEAKQSCFAIDPGIYPHAGSQLTDLRLYRDGTEIPYVLRTASSPSDTTQAVTPLNLGVQQGSVAFDAAMPDGSYSDIHLDVTAHDFIATVSVSSQPPAGQASTELGTFTIFDFTRQKLGRSTVLHLPPSNFPRLHFRITGPLHPEDIAGLAIARVRSNPPAYQVVATTSQIAQKGHSSIVEFTLPPNVPVDRIAFTPAAQPGNFSRHVTASVVPVEARAETDAEPPRPVIFDGNLLRLHRSEDGHRIDEERLAMDVSFYSGPQGSRWIITVDNGDDVPLQIASVRLEVLEHDLCFDATPSTRYTLYYGDLALTAPQYDYATFFERLPSAAHATVAPEQVNPQYQFRKDERPFTEKHPSLLWVVLLAVIVLLGVVAVRSVRRQPPA
jgi:hypothetical protein